jgi:hypothetical protein
MDILTPSQTTPKNLFLAIDNSDIREVYEIRPTSQQQLEQYICRSALISGYWCGYIIDRDVLNVNVDGSIVDHLFEVDFDAIPGDSGGPYFLLGIAFGIHNDSLDNVSPPAGKSWYTTAERVQNVGGIDICIDADC